MDRCNEVRLLIVLAVHLSRDSLSLLVASLDWLGLFLVIGLLIIFTLGMLIVINDLALQHLVSLSEVLDLCHLQVGGKYGVLHSLLLLLQVGVYEGDGVARFQDEKSLYHLHHEGPHLFRAIELCLHLSFFLSSFKED